MRARAAAVLIAWPALAIGSTPVEEGVDPSAEFRAFVAETHEQVNATRVEELEIQRKHLDRSLAVRGRAYVRLLRSGLLPLSDGYQGMLDHINRAERLRHALARDLAAKYRIKNEQRALVKSVEELRQRRERLAKNVVEYERSKEAILAARDREAAFQRAFERRQQATAPQAVYAAPAGASQHDAFAAARGRLPLPVAGRAEVRAVQLPEAVGPGVFIAVDSGALVSAVHAGRVVLTGDYGELGRSVVIEHDGGYSTLSAQLGVVTVDAGDTVRAGDSIGTLAAGAQGNLYFEVRHGGVAVDPTEWFGL